MTNPGTTQPASLPTEGQSPFFVERVEHEDGGISYEVWQRDAPALRPQKTTVRIKPKPVVFGQERLIASMSERDFPRDAKQMADRVALGLNITSDIKGMV